MGKIGAGYADDPLMARYYPYATHAQVLKNHPAFSWDGVVDPDPVVRRLARERWQVPYVAPTVDDLLRVHRPEVAVLATPPDSRAAIVAKLEGVKAVLVEKPLGRAMNEAAEFVESCARQGVLVQVNLWRRADETCRGLALGGLEQRLGRVQAGLGVYGNGLLNNGVHMIDLVRMLLGEVRLAQCMPGGDVLQPTGPLPGDIQPAFTLAVEGGASVAFVPLSFEHYRENSLDLWGERGRLAIEQEGLSQRQYVRRPHRALSGAREVDMDTPETLPSTVGHAFFHMYSNLAAALREGTALWSPAQSALRSERVVEAVLESLGAGGVPVAC